MFKAWEGFTFGKWSNDEVDVRDFIQKNYTPYEGDASFLAEATEDTKNFGILFWICQRKKEKPAVCWMRIRQSFRL